MKINYSTIFTNKKIRNVIGKFYFMFSKKLTFIIPRILISTITVLILFGFLELGLRFYVTKKPAIIFKASDPETAYKLNPNYQNIFSDVFVKINNQGFRQNGDIQLTKSADIIRIMGLGDSVAFGFGVEEEKTYLRQLEKILNTSSVKQYEVMNTAITGYNTFQERKLLEGDLLKFKPDIIILSFVLNDISGDFNVPNMVYRTLAPFKSGAYAPDNLSALEKVFYFLFQKSYLYQSLHPKLKTFWGFRDLSPNQIIGNYAKETIEFYRKGYYYQKKYTQSVPITEAELLKISDLAKKNDSDLIIVIFPVEIQLQDTALRKPQDNLMRFCQENKIKCLDLIPILEKDKNKKLFNDGIGHPNEYASRIIAKAIHEYLIEHKIVKVNKI